MKLNKYSESEDGTVVGSYADKKSSSQSSSSSSSSSPSNSKGTLDRDIWGQPDKGDDIDGDMFVDGNVFCGPVDYDDEDRRIAPDYQFPSSVGNIYATSSIASPEIYGRTLLVDYKGTKVNVLDLLLPVGSIIMFGNNKIPAGWAICNGENGTPDLRDQFILASDTVGRKGGYTSVALTPEHLPEMYEDQVEYLPKNGTGGSSARVPTVYKWRGYGAALSNMPPYYSLIFIMRIG